jgi:homoserine dehydrogenase
LFKKSELNVPVRLGIIGLGTVGQGFLRLLLREEDLLRQRLGFPLSLGAVCDRNAGLMKSLPLSPTCKVYGEAADLISDPEIDLVIELMGGIEPAKNFILESMRHGKSVVTANKALLAQHGEEIFGAASRYGVDLGFEASVGGGIPILRTLRESLAGDRIQKVAGIINGTANYILSRMTREGLEFETALKEAQRLGYAESDPTYDIDGIDSAHKIAILATMAFGSPVNFADVPVEGIRHIKPIDLEFGKEFGYVLKLLGIASDRGDSLDIRVHPSFLPEEESMLAEVDGVFNAIELKGQFLGPLLLFGRGAGGDPTATAVMGDVMECARGIYHSSRGQVPALGFPFSERVRKPIFPLAGIHSEYYLRFVAQDQPGTLSYLSGVLGDRGISIESVIQKGRQRGGSVSVVVTTHRAAESQIREALDIIDRSSHVTEKTVVIRVEKVSMEGEQS